MNNRGRLCPRCEQDIGFLAVSIHPALSTIKCPHCGSRLKYDIGSCSFIILVFPSFLGVISVSLLLAIYISGDNGFLRFLLSTIFIGLIWWIIIEVPFTLYCRRCRVLEFAERLEP